jgi:hypothetical protein
MVISRALTGGGVMGVQKRPKIRQGQLADGSEYYFFRKPTSARSSRKPKIVTPRRAPVNVGKNVPRDKKAQNEE